MCRRVPPTRMRFETNQNSKLHRGFLLEFNTDFEAVISYLIHLCLLILQARTITVIAIVVSKKKKKHKHTTNDTHTYRLHDALKLNQQR